MATCVNDKEIPSYMEGWLTDLKEKQKNEHSNLSSDEELDEDGAGADVPVEEESDGYSSGDSQLPAKRTKMSASRMSVDDRIVEVGKGLAFDLRIERGSRSMSRLSRSSRASSVVSVASSVISRT